MGTQVLVRNMAKHPNLPARIWYGLFRHDEWNIGIACQPISAFLECEPKPAIHWFAPPERGRFLAGPFGITKNERNHILCEEFDYRISKGRIVSIEIGRI